ncbi:MAG: putative manganese transporter [Bacteroidales bacterium]|nr:putative manganese transporter [Bacteroidales bacterium]
MQEEIFLVLKNSLSITFFVLAMMLFIEYINVKTSGTFSKKIQRKGWLQILIGVLFGVIPGCLGTYTVVTLFSHNMVSLGALFATFVATMGDEAFLLFSLDMKTALIITGILVLIAIIGGIVIDFVYSPKKADLQVKHFEIHEHEQMNEHSEKISFIENLRHSSPHRSVLLFGVTLIFILSILGEIGHSHDILPIHVESAEHEHGFDWFSITFMLISLGTAYIISVVPEHFLEHHFWNHIIKKHFFKVLGWTTCIIAVIHILDHFVVLQNLVNQYQWQILVAAVLIGLIPESGPHIVFISLYLSGNIPLSILLANSLTQDGHGGLPLFAESKKTFVFVKITKAIIALIIGFVGLHVGF